MVMHTKGTFAYTGVVPAKAADGGFACEMTSRDLPASHLPVLTGAMRLVGRSPHLTVRDGRPESRCQRRSPARDAARLHAAGAHP